MSHRTLAELEQGLPPIVNSPRDAGAIALIVRRPEPGQRELLETAALDTATGLVGDCWLGRGQSGGRPAHPEAQITIMNTSAVELIAGSSNRWALAGDQFYVDLDLSAANLPAGTRLELGSALLEVTAKPHTGCKKFVERFGLDAMRFVNSDRGRSLNLRGVNARVLRGGTVRVGDTMRRV